MLQKIGKCELTEATRNVASELWGWEMASCRSKMIGYSRVGDKIGMSSEWVRKFIGRQINCSPVVGRRIIRSYRELCESKMRDIEARQKEILELEGRIDALDHSLAARPRPAGPVEMALFCTQG